MLRIAIVDDDLKYCEALLSHISRYKDEKEIDVNVVTFSSGLEFISDYEPVYDILFLDIEMPYMDGMELARSIRKSDPHAVIVFITNLAQYAINGYEVNAFDYMVKPVEYMSFSIKFQKIIEAVDKSDEFSLLIPLEDGGRHMKTNEIIFIEVVDHWLYIHTKDGEYQLLGTLKKMEEKLQEHHFIRCNKSYLINLRYVVRMRSDIVVMQGDKELTISRSRRKDVQDKFIEYYSEMKW